MSIRNDELVNQLSELNLIKKELLFVSLDLDI